MGNSEHQKHFTAEHAEIAEKLEKRNLGGLGVSAVNFGFPSD